jgi:hypothetical protein
MSDIELPAPAFVIEVNDEPNMPVYTADQMRDAIKLERETVIELLDALQNLSALVWGECPSLLNEDSGGNSQLAMQIEDAIAKATAAGAWNDRAALVTDDETIEDVKAAYALLFAENAKLRAAAAPPV